MQENKPKNISAPTAIASGSCVLSGMYVNNTTSGTMVIYDATTAASGYAITGTMTPAAGYHNLGNLQCTQGVYVDLSNLDITFHIKETRD